jgi:hypothetical protein
MLPRHVSRTRHIVRDLQHHPPPSTASNPSQCVCPSRRSLVLGVGERTLGAEELSRDVESLATHNDNLLSVEQLLSDGAGKATEQVPLAVDDLIYKSAGSPLRWCGAVEIRHWQCGPRLPVSETWDSWNRSVRTMTGSKVDMVSIPGVAGG